MVSLYGNSFISLELGRVEGDRADFNGDFKQNADLLNTGSQLFNSPELPTSLLGQVTVKTFV